MKKLIVFVILLLMTFLYVNAQDLSEHASNKYFQKAMSVKISHNTTLENIINALNSEIHKITTYNEKVNNDTIKVVIILTSKQSADLTIIVYYKQEIFNKIEVIARFNGEKRIFVNNDACKALQMLATGEE